MINNIRQGNGHLTDSVSSGIRQISNNLSSFNTKHASRQYLFIKRLADVTLVILTLPLVIPIILFTALAIRVESPGNVFFRQERVGENNEPFSILKLRSMHISSEKDGAQFATENDARITRVGRFIRKMRIDELPQFWNVIKGDMSIIGPRPEQEKFVKEFEEIIPQYQVRHIVKPGITGLAQIEQGYVEDIQGTIKKLEYDLYYIENMSVLMDLRIILKTIRTILTGFGAR